MSKVFIVVSSRLCPSCEDSRQWVLLDPEGRPDFPQLMPGQKMPALVDIGGGNGKNMDMCLRCAVVLI